MRTTNSRVKYIETSSYFLKVGDTIRLHCGCYAKMIYKGESNKIGGVEIQKIKICEIISSICNIYNDLNDTPYYINGHPIGKHLGLYNNELITKLVDY